MNTLPISKTVSISKAGFNEAWLQNEIWENPSCLGYGELEGVTKEAAVSSGGRLDLLFKSSDDDTMYEVEVMLGDTDPSHIIRTIEYWELVRRRWPQRQHFGVLVAEKITKRYFNVIQILSNNVPLIAIQANIIDINGQRSLHFTKILDAYEEPDDDLSLQNENIDESYWITKSETVLRGAKIIHELTQDIYHESKIYFTKSNISIKSQGYNQIYFKKGYSDTILTIFRYGKNREEIEEILQRHEIDYSDDHKRFKFRTKEQKIDGMKELFREIATLNKQWWLS